MKFRLQRQKINKDLSLFGCKNIRKQKMHVLLASRKILKELAPILEDIQTRGLPKYLVLKKLRGKLGFGVFLHPEAKPILKNEPIAPYAGAVTISPQNQGGDSDYAFALITDMKLTRKEQHDWDPTRKYHPRRLYSIDLDAQETGNFTRFINHSEKPNIEAQLVRIPANSLSLEPAPFEIFYMAKKTIRPGEQLLVCYDGKDNSYWGALNIKPFPMTPKTFKLNSSLQVIESN